MKFMKDSAVVYAGMKFARHTRHHAMEQDTEFFTPQARALAALKLQNSIVEAGLWLDAKDKELKAKEKDMQARLAVKQALRSLKKKGR